MLSTPLFDATTLDVASLRFGPGLAAEAHGRAHTEDVDGDGLADLVLHFDTQASGLSSSDTSACLTGTNGLGFDVEGCDSVSVK